MLTNLSKKYIQRAYPLREHPVQQQLIDDTFTYNTRFNVVPSGRRSGKTEICGKRRLIARSVVGVPAPNPRYFVAAPTRDQVWRLYWNDLKILCEPHLSPIKKPSESRLIIYLKRDTEIHLLGMDKPERIEGSHWDGGILDEFGNMKEKTWVENVRPALSTPGRPPAWCDFIGVPEGRNHYYNLYKRAQEEIVDKGRLSKWGVFHWLSKDILSAEDIEQAMRDMDELTFKQEMEGSFVTFSGMAYYNFDEKYHCAKLHYNRRRPIVFCFDFNVNPGVASVIQEQLWVDPKTHEPEEDTECTGIIGEVYIKRNSNTLNVCKKLIEDWGDHEGDIYIHGDATGGSRHSSQLFGTDWDIVEKMMHKHFGDERIYMEVPSDNPRVRNRINAVNSRLLSMDNRIGMQIDPRRAPMTVKDFEGVNIIEGGSGEIDKKADKWLSHLTDAVGYYITEEYPVSPHAGMIKITGT